MKQAHVRFPTMHSGGSHLYPGASGRQQDVLSTANRGQRGSEIALLGILIVTAGVGFADRLPVLSLGITLQVPDVLLIGSLGCIAVRWLVEPEFKIVRTPLDRPLLIFCGVTLFSTLVAVVQSSLEVFQAITWIRIFSYYLTFFVVTNLIRERRQLNFLLNGIFLLATIVAVAIIGQYVLGNSVQLVQSNMDPGEIKFGATARIAPPGFSIVLVSCVTIFCILVCDRFKPIALLRLFQCGLMAMALVLTYFRSYWIALIAVMLLLVCLVKGPDRRRLIGWALVVMCPGILALLLAFTAPELPVSRLLTASWERLSTVAETGAFTGGDPNYDFRRRENEYAFPAIAANPILGLGLGAAYRPLDPRLDPRDDVGLHDRRHQIHNGHLGVLVQSGVLGYLSLMWLSLAFLLRGFTNWRKVPNNRMRAVVLGFTLVYLALLIAAGANSLFTQWYWTPVIGIIMGVNEVVLRSVRLTVGRG